MEQQHTKRAGLRLPKLQFSWAWSWRVVSTLLIIGAGLALLLFGQLESLLPGYSSHEVQIAQESSSFGAIAENPVNAPYKFVVFGLTLVGVDALLATRVASAIFGTATLLLFYVGVRHWHSRRVAFLATTLFALSAWFLFTARFGAGDIMLPFVVLLFATCGYWIAASAQRSTARYLAAVLALSLSIFIPGAIWLVLIGLIVRRGKDIQFLRRRLLLQQKIALGGLLVIFVVLPLIYGVIQTPAAGLELLALPTDMPDMLAMLREFALLPLAFIAWSNFGPEFWLGNLPLLDVFSAAMFLLGLYAAIRDWRLDRAKLLLGLLVLGMALVALGGMPIAVLLPVVYVIIAGGIATLLGQWLVVFPRNPLARSFGIILVTLAVVASLTYNFRLHYIAWPLSSETKAVYTAQTLNAIIRD